MYKEELPKGKIKLWGDNGIIDTRTGNVYSEFVGDAKKERYFIDVPVEAPAKKGRKKK